MLIESELSPLRPQRWMGHHSPAFTLETYGHLIDGDLGPALDLRKELAWAERRSTPAQRAEKMILIASARSPWQPDTAPLSERRLEA
jgi:hypothetical protein